MNRRQSLLLQRNMATKKKSWQRPLSEKNANNDEDELLVFGYACKLFRDDEKAFYIDQGKHLIPWMGDDRLMIDRYDGRGYLHDLEQYEAKANQDFKAGLTEEELKIEAVCDEERYKALYKDISEEEMYHEEELKRLRIALASDYTYNYNEVGFTYEESSNKDSYDPSQPTEEVAETIEEPFIPPLALGIPPGMLAPPTKKMNAIIEKTAAFIAQHGLQMEIVIKTKQSKNPQFAFMAFDDPLNPYYKHMVQSIKSGKYQPRTQETENSHKDDDEDDDDEDNSHYLHPSLLVNRPAVPKQVFPTIPRVNYQRGQADDWYSILVNQLKDKVTKNVQSSASSRSSPSPAISEPSSQGSPVADYNLQLPSYSAYPIPTDPSLPPPPGLEPVTLPSTITPSPSIADTGTIHTAPPGIAMEIPDSKQMNCMFLHGNSVLPPPPDIQPIIDKMASYVAKNGQDFETIVLNKGDKRFDFLHSWHEFHAYYQFKKSVYEQQFMKEAKPPLPTSQTQSLPQPQYHSQPDLSDSDSNASSKSKPAPVSFSIKSKEPEMMPLDKRSALGLDDETSESDGEEGKNSKKEEGDKVTPTDKKEKNEEKESKTEEKQMESKPRKTKSEHIDAKLAEEKVKDRIAAAAREKLASASREKQLQLERKKRATLFLNYLRNDKTSVPPKQEEKPVIGPQLPPEMIVSVEFKNNTSSPTTDSVNGKSQAQLSLPNQSYTVTLASASSSKSVKDVSSNSKSSKKGTGPSRSRSRSPSRKKKRRSRSRSRKRSRSRHRSKSRSKSPKSKSKKAKTPPAAYSFVRRSRSSSPRHRLLQTQSKLRDYKRSHYSPPHSRSDAKSLKRSNSPSWHRSKHSRSRSRSRSKPFRSQRSSSKSKASSKSEHSPSKHRSKKSPS